MKLSERAWQAWPLLTAAAANRQLLTYELLSKLTGMHTPGLGDVLERIQSFCLLNNLPPLTAIVVNKNTGLPGRGFIAAIDAPRAFMQVFVHDWSATPCPSPDQLEDASHMLPSNGTPTAASGSPSR
jgi:hypothetical protein